MLTSFIIPDLLYAGWADDWLDQKTVTQPSYFEGQKRGYISGGALQMRLKNTNDNLFTVEPPRVKAGCGGIDIFGGGISFLNEDYLVDKFQNIIQVAPAVAFQMAMGTLCKQCQTIMNNLEDISNGLNSIQVNDCRLAKRLVAPIMNGPDQETMGEIWSGVSTEMNLKEGVESLFTAAQRKINVDNGASQVVGTEVIDGCPAEFRAYFRPGSLVQNAAEELNMEDYEGLIRGFIGDIRIHYDEDVKTFAVEPLDRCQENSEKGYDEFMAGTVLERNRDGECREHDTQSIRTWVINNLNSIIDKMKGNDEESPLTSAEEDFIDQSPLPVFHMLKSGVLSGTEDHSVSILVEPLATAYAYKITSDFYNTIDYVLDKSIEASQLTGLSRDEDGNDLPAHRCNARVLISAFDKLRVMRNDISEMQDLSRLEFDSDIATLSNNLNVARKVLEDRISAYRQTLGDLGN